MAEEIINIRGIKGQQKQDVSVATGGVRMADLEKYFNSKQKELHSLIASVTSPTSVYFSNVISTIQTADKKAQEWNELLVESIFGLETISKSILDAELSTNKTLSTIAQSLSNAASLKTESTPAVVTVTGITDYLDFIVDAILEVSGNIKAQTKSADSWLSLISEQLIESDKKSSTNSIYNAYTSKAFEIIHKMIQQPYNESFLNKVKLEDILTKGASESKTTTTNVDIKGNFDIKSLSDFISNSTFYNPLMAKMFRQGFLTVSRSINDGLGIIGESVQKVEPANILAAGELLVKIGSLVSTQQEVGKELSLFGKNVINFQSKDAVWTKKNAKRFKESFDIIAESITNGLGKIANIEVQKASLKMNDIIKFFSALQDLLQGEIRSAAGTSFSIGSLIKFSGAGTQEFVDAFSPSNVHKFDTSLQMISEMMTRFFGNISKLRMPKKEKIELILSTMVSVSDSMQEIKGVSKKKIANLNDSLICLVVGFKSFSEELKGVEMPKDNKIMTIMTVISVVSKALERMKGVPNPQKTITRFIVGITSLYTAIGQIEIDSKSSTNLEIIKGSIETLSAISNKISDIKNPTIKINNFISGLNNIIGWLVSVPAGKQYVSKAVAMNDIVDVFIIISNKIDSIKDPKPAEKAIKVLSYIIKTISLLEKQATKAKKVSPLLVTVVTTVNKAFENITPESGKNIQQFSKGISMLSISILMISVMEKPAKGADKVLNIVVNSVAKTSKELGKKEVTSAVNNLKMLAVGMATIGLAAVAFVLLSPAILTAMFGLRLFKSTLTGFGSRKTQRAIKASTLGIASFALAVWAFGEIVNCESMLKTAGALALLAGAMYMFNGGSGGGILGKWGGIKDRKGDPTKQMMKTAAALALLALSVYAWQELPLGWDGVFKMGTGLVALAGACWAYSKLPPKADNNMIKIAVALGVMAGSVWLWQKTLDVSRWKELLVIGSVIAGIGFASLAFSKVPEKAGTTMLKIAAGVAALGGAVWIWQKASPTWETLLIMGVGIVGIGAASLIYEKVSKKSAINMGLLASGVIALGGAVWVWEQVSPSWELLGMMAAAVGGLAIASFVFDKISPLSGVNMLLVAAGVAALGGAVWIWQKASPTWETLGMMAAVLAGGATMALLYALPPVLIGAAGMLAVGASMLAISGSFAIVKNIGLTTDDAKNFTSVLWEIAVGFAKVAIPVIPAAVAAGLFIPVALGTLASARVLALISKLPAPDTKKINLLMQGTSAIISGWDDISLWNLGKAAVKAASFIVVGPMTYMAAVTLRMIAGLNINDDKVNANTESLFSFIDTVSTKFNEIGSGKKADKIKKGAEAVGGVAKVVYDLSKAVMAVAALQYEEYDVKDGKLVLKSVNKLTEKDFELVGVGIAKLLNAITDPLVKIGEANGNDIQIGYQRIPGQNKIEKGVKAISGISGVFTPLANLVKSIAETGILKDKNADEIISRLTTVISQTTDAIDTSALTIIRSVSQIEIEDPEGLKSTFESIGSIYEPVSSVIQAIQDSGLLKETDPAKFDNFKVIFSSIVSALGDNASKIVSFVKSKGGFWNSSDTNAESIVQVLNSVGKVYDPLNSVLKSISDTGILSAESDTASTRLKEIIPVITDSLSSTVQKILKMVEDNEDINAGAATKVMTNMNNLIKPVSVLIATISSTGILDDKNVDGVVKLQSVMKTVVDSVVYMIERISGQNTGISAATSSLSVFFKSISDAKAESLVSIRTEIDAIHAKIIDDTPWVKFGKNLQTYEKITANIQRNINRVDLQKLVLLEKFAKDLKDANLNGNMEELIKEIRELINAIEDQNETYENNFTQNNFGGDTSTTNNVTGDQMTDPDSSFSMATSPVGGDTQNTQSQSNSSQAAISRIATELQNLIRTIQSKR